MQDLWLCISQSYQKTIHARHLKYLWRRKLRSFVKVCRPHQKDKNCTYGNLKSCDSYWERINFRNLSYTTITFKKDKDLFRIYCPLEYQISINAQPFIHIAHNHIQTTNDRMSWRGYNRRYDIFSSLITRSDTAFLSHRRNEKATTNACPFYHTEYLLLKKKCKFMWEESWTTEQSKQMHSTILITITCPTSPLSFCPSSLTFR